MAGRTVRDFKDFFLRETGVESCGQLPHVSMAHAYFWQKLNRLGGRNLDRIPAETVPDIDATVELDEREWDGLLQEFRALQ